MSSERSIEITGDSVEEAIAKGLAELGASPTDVIVEVLDEPSRGVFGLGARPARVRLKVFRAPAPPPMPMSTPPARPAQSKPPSPPKVAAPRPAPSETKAAAPPAKLDIAVEHDDEDDAIPLLDEMQEVEEAALDEDARVARVVLTILLEKMAMNHARVVIRRAANKDSDNPWLLDVVGPNLNPLIGKRGDTLASLQYVTRLIASRELQHRANIVVDVGGYKLRRSRMLRDLAVRMADQAVQNKRVVTLEPMPPYERRIVHLTLRSRPDVQTKSIGEGSARKVTIIPKSS